jgi:multidrug transporter EmrE-like cation transporter
MMKAYLLLLCTILVESCSIVLMKMSHGGINKRYLVASMTAYFVTFFLLTYTFKFFPMGWANAIWAGSSTVLVCIFGILFFHEKINITQAFFLLCIVVGLVGLNFFGKTE